MVGQGGPTADAVASRDVRAGDKPGLLGGWATAAGTAIAPAEGCAAPSTTVGPTARPVPFKAAPPRGGAGRGRSPVTRGGRARGRGGAGPAAAQRSAAQLRGGGSGGSARRDPPAPTPAPPLRSAPLPPPRPAPERGGPSASPGRGAPARPLPPFSPVDISPAATAPMAAPPAPRRRPGPPRRG